MIVEKGHFHFAAKYGGGGGGGGGGGATQQTGKQAGAQTAGQSLPQACGLLLDRDSTKRNKKSTNYLLLFAKLWPISFFNCYLFSKVMFC